MRPVFFAALLAIFGLYPLPRYTYGAERIVTFGDSTTAPRNVGAANNGRPTDRLSSYGQNNAGNTVTMVDHTDAHLYVYTDVIRDELPTRGFALSSADNEGIGGNRTDQALGRLDSDVRSKNPDIVAIQFGINDSAHDGGPGTPSRVPLDFAEQYGPDGAPGGGDDHVNAARGNYESNLVSIVRTLKADGSRVILMTSNRITDYSAVTEARLTLYVQVVRDVASAEGTELVDVWQMYTDYMAQPGQEKSDLLLDGVHPNGRGQRLVADGLMNLFAPVTTPLVIAHAATNLTTHSACLNGTLTYTGASAAAVGVYWGRVDGQTNEGEWAYSHDFGIAAQAPPVAYSLCVSNLDEYTSYVYRYRAANLAGADWSDAQPWATRVDEPAQGFAPTNLAGLLLWLDGADIDGDGTSDVLPDGSPVASWTDKSGQGNDAHAASAVPGEQPEVTLGASGPFNGLQVVQLSGVANCYLLTGTNSTFNALHNGNGATVFMLYQLATDAGDIAFVLDSGMTTSANTGYSFAPDRRSAADSVYFVIRNAMNTFNFRADYANQFPRNSAELITQTYAYVGGTNDVALYTNGVRISTTSGLLAGPPSGADATRVMEVGAANGNSRFKGELAEIVVYDRVLSQAEQEQVGNYLTEKYGLINAYVADTDNDGLNDLVDDDDDGDDMPDRWENDHQLNRRDSSDRNTHADTDFIPNIDEYVADTDPQDPNSYFAVSIALAPGGTQLEFLSAPGRAYGIDYANDLTSGGWAGLTNGVSGTGSTITIEDDTASGERHYSARVGLAP